MMTKAVLALKSQDEYISFPDSVFSIQIFVRVCLVFKWHSNIRLVGENVEWKKAFRCMMLEVKVKLVQ